MKTKKSGTDQVLLMGIFTVHLISQKCVFNDDMQQFYIHWPAHELLKCKSKESTAGSAHFHKLTTAKTTCTHNVFGNEERFRKIISLQTIYV